MKSFVYYTVFNKLRFIRKIFFLRNFFFSVFFLTVATLMNERLTKIQA